MDSKELIRNRRLELGLTQEELAGRLSDLGQETRHARVGHWETGRNRPPLEDRRFREALARVLEIDSNQMMESLGFIRDTNEQTEEARLGATIIDRLPQKARQIALAQLKALEKAFSS